MSKQHKSVLVVVMLAVWLLMEMFLPALGVPTLSTAAAQICEGDFDHDGDVDGSDLATFAADFGRTDCEDYEDKIVFVSSATYSGNLGGIAGADAKCQELASAAGLSGTYMAWLSDSATYAAERLTHSAGRYVRTDGAGIAFGWEDLIDGTIMNPINFDESGHLIGPTDYVWTGTRDDGTLIDPSMTCANWTSGSYGINGIVGNKTMTDTCWTDFRCIGWYLSTACGSPGRIYCVQQ